MPRLIHLGDHQMHHSRYFVTGFVALTVVTGSVAFGQPPALPAASPPPAEKKDVPGVDGNAQLMETVGLLSGLYLYQAYLNIGLIADGKAEKIYDDKAVRSVLGTVV